MTRRIFTFLFLICCAAKAFSQSSNTPLFAKAQTFTNEVFLNCPVFTDSVHVAINAEIMSRIEVMTEPYHSTETYRRLSTIQLKNKCNPAMTRDELNFNAANFNPLKYFLNWFPDTVTKYRVDNSDKIIVVHPKL